MESRSGTDNSAVDGNVKSPSPSPPGALPITTAPPITLNLVFPGLCPWLRLLSPLLSLGHLRVSTVSCSVVWLRRFILQI